MASQARDVQLLRQSSFMLSLVVVYSFVAAPRASAYRTLADTPEFAGEPVRWRSPAIEMDVATQDLAGLSRADVDRAVRAAFETWNEVPCSGVTIALGGFTDSYAAPGDGRNTIQWVSTAWSARGYAADAAATTDVQFGNSGEGWEIVEADIYLNADTFRFVAGDPGGDATLRDLQAVITHEVGHAAIGLLHPCEHDGGDGAPLCRDDGPEATSALYPRYLGMSQRALSADDAAGACFLYPSETCATLGCPEGLACVEDRCVTPMSEPPPGCTSDAECFAHERCVAGACVLGDAPAGDPCTDAHECSGAACVDGHCTRACETDAHCPESFGCIDAVCTSELGLFADSCSDGRDCASGLCLTGSASGSFCTRECAVDACPTGFACAEVGGRSVCRMPPSGGCAVAASEGPPWAQLSVAWFVLAMLVRRRRP